MMASMARRPIEATTSEAVAAPPVEQPDAGEERGGVVDVAPGHLRLVFDAGTIRIESLAGEDKTGAPRWRGHGWYTTPNSALTRCVELLVEERLRDRVANVDELVGEVRRAAKECAAILEQLR